MSCTITVITAASVLTLSATIVKMTAAIVAPICGIRSSSPVITASTSGNGSPRIHDVTPATVAATIEIATLPISEDEIAVIEFSSTGLQRCSVSGGANPNNHEVIA